MFIVRCLDVDHIHLPIQLIGNGVGQEAVKERVFFLVVAGMVILNLIAHFVPAFILYAGLDFQFDLVDQGDIMKHGIGVFRNKYAWVERSETT